MNLTDNIIELNRDMEPFVIQASATRPPPFKAKFGDPYAVLQFLHFLRALQACFTALLVIKYSLLLMIITIQSRFL